MYRYLGKSERPHLNRKSRVVIFLCAFSCASRKRRLPDQLGGRRGLLLQYFLLTSFINMEMEKNELSVSIPGKRTFYQV